MAAATEDGGDGGGGDDGGGDDDDNDGKYSVSNYHGGCICQRIKLAAHTLQLLLLMMMEMIIVNQPVNQSINHQ